MKPQLYFIVILLLAGIKAENSTQHVADSNTQQPPIPIDNNNTSVANPPKDNVTSVTKNPSDHRTSAPETNEDNVTSVTKTTSDYKTSAPETNEDNVTSVTKTTSDHKTSAPETNEDNVTSVTKAPKVSTTSLIKTSREIIVSEIPADKVTVLSEAPNNQHTSASSLAPNVPPVATTKGITTATRSGETLRAHTGITSILIGNQTSNPIVAENATTQRDTKTTNAVHKTTRLTSTKSTTGNRTSAFPVPSLFAIVLLVVSVLCF